MSLQNILQLAAKPLDFLNRTPRRNLWILLGLALLMRIGTVLMAPTFYSTDSFIYRGMGQSILEGQPAERLPNGLPLVEAGLIAALGSNSIYGLLVLNVIVSVVSCGLVYLLAKHYMGPRTAWLALIMVAVYPHTLNFVRFELTETISVALILASFWWLAKQRYLLAGTAFGILWLFRSSMLPVGLLVALLLILLPYSQQRWMATAKYVLGFALIWLVNFALVKMAVIKPSVNFTENILWAISATSTEGIPFERGNDPELAKDPVGAYLRFLQTHPKEWLRQRASSLWELLGPWPSAGFGPTARGSGTRLIIGLRFVLLILALGAAWRIRNRWTLLLFTPLIGIVGLHFFFFSEPRFLVPVEPFLMILSAAFLVKVVGGEKEVRV